MTKTIVLDLETKRLAQDVGGWSNIEKMGLVAAVSYDIQSKAYARFTENQVEGLLDTIHQSELIVGFNLLRFDYVVLKPYGLRVDQDLIRKSVDLLVDIYNALGFRIGLGNLAKTTLGESKHADGVQSVQWYRNGEIEKVLDYCEQDVRVTYELWKYGSEHGYVSYKDRMDRVKRVHVDW
jgi:DEAD/DEAH box helicase domain-containing protein